MTKREMLIVDAELVRRIDENRGHLTRGQFLELCVSRHIDEASPGHKREPRAEECEMYTSRREFAEFRSTIKGLVGAFIELLIDYRLGEERRGERYLDESLSEGKPTAETELLRVGGRYRESFAERSGDYEGGESEAHHPQTCGGHQQSRRPVEALKRHLREVVEGDERPPHRQDSAGTQHSRATPGEVTRPRRGVKEQTEEEQDYYDLPRAITNAARNLKSRLSEMFGQGKLTESSKEISSSRHVHRESVDSSDENAGQNMYLSLWIPAILLFGFGDTLLSTMVFAKGGYEANALMGSLVSLFGGSIFTFVLIKTIALVVLALISFKVFRHMGWVIPSILCVVGTYLVLSNLIAYLSL